MSTVDRSDQSADSDPRADEGAGQAPEQAGDVAAAYAEVYHDPQFVELRRRFRSFVFPVTVGFLVWYFLYVLLASYASDFMSTKLVGNINVALVFGLLQFVSTFAIAWWYARKANRDFDPIADKLRHEFEEARR